MREIRQGRGPNPKSNLRKLRRNVRGAAVTQPSVPVRAAQDSQEADEGEPVSLDDYIKLIRNEKGEAMAQAIEAVAKAPVPTTKPLVKKGFPIMLIVMGIGALALLIMYAAMMNN